MCEVMDIELDAAYYDGYMEGLEKKGNQRPIAYHMNGLGSLGNIGLGAFSLGNFPTTLVAATVANQLASKDELLNVHLDKLEFLQDDGGAVRKELRGGLKIIASGLAIMYTNNQIAQAAALGVALSGANDLFDYAKENQMLGLSGVGAAHQAPAGAAPQMVYQGVDYDAFGMSGYEHYEEIHEQTADLEDQRNSMRV